MKQMYGYSDMRPGRVASGGEAFLMRHWHMVLTVPGTLPQDPEWGIGLPAYLGKNLSDGDIPQLRALARSAHMRDAETQAAEVTIELVAAGQVRYKARLTPINGVVVELDRVVSA